MKYKSAFLIMWAGIFLVLIPLNVYANSSWHWVTMSPLRILPFAIILTLLVEAISIVKLGKVENSKKALVVVSLANLISFIAPYLVRAYRFIPTSGGYSIMTAFDKGPYYMILSGYLILTIIVELPVVYSLLKKHSAHKKSLITAVLLSNIATTFLVAVLERIICVGRW